MKNYTLPTWLSFLIGLIVISAINVAYKHYTKSTTDKWGPFETVARTASKNLLSDTVERKKWCDCVVKTFKEKYPDGLNDLNQDSLNSQMALTSYNCIHAIRHSK